MINIYNKFYYKIFKEKINVTSAEEHHNDSEWIDNNWDKLVEYFKKGVSIYRNFNHFIKIYLLISPDIKMLDILLKHDYNFDEFCERALFTHSEALSYING